MKTVFITILLLLTAVAHIHAQPGTLDKSFGTGGKILDTSIWADCQAMTIQPDGKILTGGYTDDSDYSNSGGLYIARYNVDGTTDESFGEKGKVIIRKANGGYPLSAQSIVVQPEDGKIIVCNRFIPKNYYSHVGIVRLYPNGTIDSSFGTNGFVVTKLSKWSDLIGGMVLQPDGKIVVAGNSQSNYLTPGSDFLLRYLPDGTPDESFGENGVSLTYYTDAGAYPGGLILQQDGKILTGGIYTTSKNRYQVVRYNSDGSLDKSFGEGGFARLLPQLYDNAIAVSSITVQPDGKVILAGTGGGEYRIALVRFNGDGTVDEGFGDKQGYTLLPMDEGEGLAKSVFYSATERKIIATALYRHTATQQVAAVRYNDNGVVDSSFGENGVSMGGGFTENKYGADISSGIGAVQPDGRIIVSGSFGRNDGDIYNVALFRFNNDNNKQPLAVRIKRWLQHHGISWQGVQGSNNIRYYAVQRSGDGIIYKDIAKVSKKGGSNMYEDNTALNNIGTYYRVAAVSWDGSRTYSNTVLIDGSQQAKIFPNPVRDNLQLQGLPQSGKTNLSVLDLNGNVRSTATATGTNYSVNTTNLSSGSYLLKIQHGGTTTTQPFVKE